MKYLASLTSALFLAGTGCSAGLADGDADSAVLPLDAAMDSAVTAQDSSFVADAGVFEDGAVSSDAGGADSGAALSDGSVKSDSGSFDASVPDAGPSACQVVCGAITGCPRFEVTPCLEICERFRSSLPGCEAEVDAYNLCGATVAPPVGCLPAVSVAGGCPAENTALFECQRR